MVLQYDEVYQWLNEDGESEVGVNIYTKYDEDVEPSIYMFNDLQKYSNIILKCNYPITKLSPNLKRLEIIDEYIVGSNRGVKNFNFKEILDNLSETLIYLNIFCELFNESLDKLPSGFQY